MNTPKAPHQSIKALLPRDESGTQFLLYGDCCSGVPGALHESTFASVNAVASHLWPQPEFICFLGDEISGLTADYEALRAQWSHWLEREMKWLNRETIPLYHVTSNHTTYDETSEQIFREVLSHLPGNGPKGQEGLSYFVRRNDLLLVFINTSTSALGGDGFVETEWLDKTLQDNSDVRYKLVLGHQPIHPVKGSSGPRMREVVHDNGRLLWDLFVKHEVFAYVCSHMLCFDVQVHQGILQILTSGAGTAHIPPDEYLHFTQCAIDREGLRYQAVDNAGQVREGLSWPLRLQPSAQWKAMPLGITPAQAMDQTSSVLAPQILLFEFSGVTSLDSDGRAETFLSAWQDDAQLAPLWIGLCGINRVLTVKLTPVEGRSPQIWRGPALAAGEQFLIQVAIHSGMGPGGILWRRGESFPWTSLAASSQWGAERLKVPETWSVGHDRASATRAVFRGRDLYAKWHSQIVPLA